jgi:hypothetical protein
MTKRLARVALPVTAACLLRLTLACVADETADISAHHKMAYVYASGGQLYTHTAHIPYVYPPPWWFLTHAADVLAQRFGGFAFWIILPSLLADIGTVWLLGFFWSPLLAWLYAVNPVALVITALQGQFDPIPTFFSVLALALFQRSHRTSAALSLAGGIAVKSFPVLLVPLFIRRVSGWWNRCAFGCLALLPTVVLLFPHWLRDAHAVRTQAFGHTGVIDQGWLAFVRYSPRLFLPPHTPDAIIATAVPYAKAAFLFAYGLVVAWDVIRPAQGRPLVRMVAAVYLLFYAIYTNLSSQYLLWALPFLLISSPGFAVVYTIAASFALFGFYTAIWPGILYPKGILQPHLSQAVRFVWYRWGTLVWWATSVAGLIVAMRPGNPTSRARA